MARPLRYIRKDSVVEVTNRTIQSRFLLRPSPELNALILGVLGRAQSVCPGVDVHAFVFLSNHYHMLLSPADHEALSDFMEYVNGNIAREAGRLHDWRDKFWARRYQSIEVADEAAQWDRLRYIFSHGGKEGLVARPGEWPGVHCIDALTKGTLLTGTWVRRSEVYEAGRRKRGVDLSAFCTEYPVLLTPLPCGADMSPEAYRQQCTEIVGDIERECARTNAALGRRPLGPATILRQHPHDMPRTTKRSPAPRVHATLRRVREECLRAYRWFESRYREAAERLRRGEREVTFPPGAFPPPAPFVSPAWGPVAATGPP